MSRRPSLQRQQVLTAWLFLAPTLALLIAVGIYPLAETLRLSFTDAFAGSREPVHFVGLKNFRELYGEASFWRSVGNTMVFTVSSVALEFVLGLSLALIVNSNFRGRGIVRGAMLIPWALPTVVAARMWAWMLNDQFGVIDDLLYRKLHLLDQPIAWTAQSGYAMAAVVMVDVWKTTPFVALLLLAGLQLIPEGLYEAADVDGAGPFQKFLTITLPLLKPAMLVALIFRTLDALRVFDVVWVLTGGEFGTETMGTYNYRSLVTYSRVGYGSAVSVTIFFVIALFVVLYVKTVRLEETQ